MNDDLDALRAALRAPPAPDPEARSAALRLAMENFDRAQGSATQTRLDQDRPIRAGFLNGVRMMLNTLTTRPALAATTSVAALCIGLFVAWPQLQRGLPPIGPAPLAPAPMGQPALEAKPAEPASPAPRVDATAVPRPAPAPKAADRAKSDAMAESAPAELDSGVALPAPGQMVRESAPPAPPMTAEALKQSFSSNQVRGMLLSPDAILTDSLTAAEPDTEAFANAPANPVHVTAEDPVSTFSVDVDTASYAVIRSSLNAGQLPPAEAVRIEEMVNYFPYTYPAPTGDAPFATTATVMPTPWNPGTRLVHIALQGRPITERPPLNLVFLIDTSGSMDGPGRLPLLKQSLALMLGKLQPQDRVAIVAYAGAAGTVLPPTAAANRDAILTAMDNLAAGGFTAGAEGLALAYQVADQMKTKGSVTRVLLATDGDFNVGIADPEALKTFVVQGRQSGTYLSVLGFGRGNLDDATMQALAQNGNGTASYIDTLSEAQKVLGDQLTGALFPIADDVKIQVEWNPAAVAEYRLIGYETRALRREDFNNDRVDAGEIGAGLQVTALYEVTAPGSPALLNDALRYGTATEATASPELGFLRLRYKEPGQTASQLIETPITGQGDASDDTRFAAAVAGFGQLLQGSPYIRDWTYDQAIALAAAAKGPDPYGYRAEAVTLMRLAQSLTTR